MTATNNTAAKLEHDEILRAEIKAWAGKGPRPDKFKYFPSLGRDYGTAPNVRSVTFNIGRYGGVQRTIKFRKPVSEAEAIAKVEEYLCAPMTEHYFRMVKGDLFGKPKSWSEANYLKIRGHCLGDAFWLERLEVDAQGDLKLRCGS